MSRNNNMYNFCNLLREVKEASNVCETFFDLASVISNLYDSSIPFNCDSFFASNVGLSYFKSLVPNQKRLVLSAIDVLGGSWGVTDYVFLTNKNDLLVINTSENDTPSGNLLNVKVYRVPFTSAIFKAECTDMFTMACFGENMNKKFEYRVFRFVDEIGAPLTHVHQNNYHFHNYKPTKYLESISGKDIRDILTPIDPEDLIDKMLEYCQTMTADCAKGISRTRNK